MSKQVAGANMAERVRDRLISLTAWSEHGDDIMKRANGEFLMARYPALLTRATDGHGVHTVQLKFGVERESLKQIGRLISDLPEHGITVGDTDRELWSATMKRLNQEDLARTVVWRGYMFQLREELGLDGSEGLTATWRGTTLLDNDDEVRTLLLEHVPLYYPDTSTDPEPIDASWAESFVMVLLERHAEQITGALHSGVPELV